MFLIGAVALGMGGILSPGLGTALRVAMDPTGNIYTASVYPPHGGELRGIEGPSFVRWKRSGG